MSLFWVILFWMGVVALAHSYVLYPLWVRWAAKGKSNNAVVHQRNDQLPPVSFIMSLYNEALVIEEKLATLTATDYPSDQLRFYIGSDCSSDETNALVEAWASQMPQARFSPFPMRRGKPSVINDLIAQALEEVGPDPNHVLIVSDANVLLEKDTVYQLVKHFKNETIGLVDSNIQHPKQRKFDAGGIGASEDTYISREVQIKHWEGVAWGVSMGPLGGCYALRAKWFQPVPPHLLVDDFYLAMRVFEQGGQAINELDAICYEVVSNDIKEEFRRKKRISAGNFANLRLFRHLLQPIWKPLGFAFLSHKVLRWWGPFFIVMAYLSLAILAGVYHNQMYTILFLLATFGLWGIPLLDALLRRLNIHLKPLRYITYFNAMNLALLNGFFNYLKGDQHGIWQPTKRNR